MKRLLACVLAFLPFAAVAAPFAREAVAATLVLEAGGTGVRGMTAVMHVIHNRASSSHTTYFQVVTKRSQFQVMAKGTDYAVRKARSHAMWGVALKIYDTFILRAQGSDFTLGATHFESFRHRKPWWTKGMVETTRVGGNVFYRPRRKS